MAAALRVFTFEPAEGQPTQCCSGRHRSNTAVAGDLVVLPSKNAEAIAESMPKALKEIKGRALTALIKRAKVKDVEELASLPHEALQAAKAAPKPAPKPSED